MLHLIFMAFGIPLACALILMPVMARLAHKLRIVDVPSARKIHLKPTPMLGGLAVYAAVICYEVALGAYVGKIIALMAACGGTVALGAADDRYDIQARFRFGVHMALGAMLGVAGFRTHLMPYFLDVTFSTIWIAGSLNAVNCWDCADGVVGGMSSIALFCYAVVLVVANHGELGSLCFAFAGASAGFLIYNFPPARIFMGDCGSTTFGLLLGAISLRVSTDSAPQFFWCAALPIVLPVADILIVHIRRYISGQRNLRDLLSSAGKDHLPHRLLHSGMSSRQTAVVIYLLTAVLSGAMIVMRWSVIYAVIMISLGIIPTLIIEFAHIRRVAGASPTAGETSVEQATVSTP